MIKRTHRARLSLAEYQNLIEAFPAQAKSLEKVVYFGGAKAFVDLTTLPAQIKEQLGPQLTDRLYKSAYRLSEESFLTFYHQVYEVLNLPKSKVSDILEIGPGQGIFQALINLFEYNVLTLDLILDQNPDVCADIRTLPVKSKEFDLVCAFEVLEHLPHRYFQPAIKEMMRVTKHYLYISLPCPTSSFYFRLNPKLKWRFFRRFSFDLEFFSPLPTRKLPDRDEQKLLQRKDAHNPHYWEVNRKSYPKKKVLAELEACGLEVLKAFHNPVFPYHYFILCAIVE